VGAIHFKNACKEAIKGAKRAKRSWLALLAAGFPTFPLPQSPPPPIIAVMCLQPPSPRAHPTLRGIRNCPSHGDDGEEIEEVVCDVDTGVFRVRLCGEEGNDPEPLQAALEIYGPAWTFCPGEFGNWCSSPSNMRTASHRTRRYRVLGNLRRR
jgi:hypothetical protein